MTPGIIHLKKYLFWKYSDSSSSTLIFSTSKGDRNMVIIIAEQISNRKTISVTKRMKILDALQRLVNETVIVIVKRHIRVDHEKILNTNQKGFVAKIRYLS